MKDSLILLGQSEDAYHFVAYVPSGNRLMELDGLRPAPIRLDNLGEGGDWLEAAVPAIRQRIESCVGATSLSW